MGKETFIVHLEPIINEYLNESESRRDIPRFVKSFIRSHWELHLLRTRHKNGILPNDEVFPAQTCKKFSK
jgi:hypothetical protein